ncbi:Calx-beta domain-containing protein [Teichococcus oryzae]|uniref:Calx-beta domain-containing protein n=1 Tax=Teichococcus oryzae TaxID=1608942 RepID=A0A5B2T9Q4_9PROT|nr:Calx-beta domain-containing protein [Pseudoroseomonas oryzae]KAA2211332.1 hypothetical protein F0Q34_20680 [Pseudoroseomonas oryzae]
MDPIVTQNPDGTWTVVTIDGNVVRTNQFLSDWTFTGASVVTTNGGTVTTEEYNASEQLISAKSVITEAITNGIRVTTNNFNADWQLTSAKIVETTPNVVTTMDFDAGYVMTGATTVTTDGDTVTTRVFDSDWNIVSETTTGGEPTDQPTISIGDVSVAEGDTATFTVTLSKAATEPVTVQYATTPGDTAAGDIGPTSGTLNFAVGETTQTIEVPTGHNIVQNPNKSFGVTLSNPEGATIADGEATGTIVDNDADTDLPAISIADAPTVVEGGQAVFTISLNHATNTDVTVKYVIVPDSATAGQDYEDKSGTITIPAGQTSVTLSVATIDDTVDDPRDTEAFSVTLSDPMGAILFKDGAVGRITDNDAPAPQPSVSIADTSVTEGGLMTFTVTLSAPAAGPTSVEYFSSLSPNVADWISSAGTLDFAAGETSKTITLQTKEDILVEDDETVTMTLINPVGMTLGDAVATGTITDNDSGTPVDPTISINDVTVNEGGNAVFTISLSQAPAAGQTVTLNYATENGTAVSGADYIGKSGKITFNAGQTTTSVVVAINDDPDKEGAETFRLELSDAVGGTIGKASGTATINASDADNPPPPGDLTFAPVSTGRILDNTANGTGPDSVDNLTSVLTTMQRDYDGMDEEHRGALEFNLSSVSGTVTAAVLRVQMEHVWDSPEQLKAYVYTGDGQVTMADWNAGTEAGTVNFTTSGPQDRAWVDITLNAGTVQAAKAAGGIVGIIFRPDGLETPTMGPNGTFYDGGASFYRDGATLFISASDEPPPPPVPSVTISDATVDEGDVATFNVTLSSAAMGPVTVNYATSNGTAAASDFTARTGTLTFTAGETSKTITVQTTEDTTVEPDETFNVTLSAPSGATLGEKTSAVGTIVNDDQAPLPALSVSNATVTEGEQATFTITLSAAAAGPVTVGYTTANGTALSGSDYTAASGILTFAAGETSKTVTIATINDTVVEVTESFNFNLTDPAGATIANGIGLGTITDNDTSSTPNLINGTAAADTLNGTDGADIINGLGGADTLYGAAGDDRLSGGAGNDILRGLEGDDILEGGLGRDRLEGGSGADRFILSDAAHSRPGDERDIIADFSSVEGDKIDLSLLDANAALPGDQDFTFLGRGSADRAIGQGEVKYYHWDGNTYLVGDTDGDRQADFQIALTGLHDLTAGDLVGLSNVRLSGSAAQDVLIGSAGNDILRSLAGNDILRGLAGDDILEGGLGKDRLEGGSGADRFVFSSAVESGASSYERDVIADWGAGDRIDLTSFDANADLEGMQQFTYHGITKNFFAAKAGELWSYQYGDNTYLIAGTDADNTRDFQIEILGKHILTADMILGLG